MRRIIQFGELCKPIEKHGLICHNIYVATPRQARKGGSTMSTFFVSFIVSVVASIVAYYICKWLDGDE